MRKSDWFAPAMAALMFAAPALAQVRPDTSQPWREFQWLYGSGEAAAVSIQAYNVLLEYALARAEDRRMGRPLAQAIMTGDVSRPSFEPCGDKPLAVVFDVDETLVLNIGAEYWASAKEQSYEESRVFDPPTWEAWEREGAQLVDAVPGAVDTVNALRAANVRVIFNSNRSAANAAHTAAAIAAAGLGAATLGEDLLLDDTGRGQKDPRRSLIAQRWCVVAMGGDQLGDFSDFFNRDGAGANLSVGMRRGLVQSAAFRRMWGHGWFALPNPVYGRGTNGTFGDVFPARRWTHQPPAQEGRR